MPVWQRRMPRCSALPVAPKKPVRKVVDQLQEIASQKCISMDQIVVSFGEASFLPILMVIALLLISPLSGIPLFSSLCGISTAFVASQMFMGRDHLWLPDVIGRQQVTGQRLRHGIRRLGGLADWLDDHARRRLMPLVRGPAKKGLQLLCILCGLCMPFLELVPFSSSILGGAILLFSTAILTRDGVFALMGLGLMAFAAFVPITVFGAVIF